MQENIFINLYASLPTPVIVIKRAAGMPTVFANAGARLLLNPLLTTDSLKDNTPTEALENLMSQQNHAMLDTLVSTVEQSGALDGFKASLINHEGIPVPVSIDANLITLADGDYLVLYIHRIGDEGISSSEDVNATLAALFQLTNQSGDMDESINKVLAYIGNTVNVSRAYIFEEISAEETRNTYEWCAAGVEPAIQDLQNLKKADYNYDAIVQSGMYITDSVQELPENDRVILEAQGIKSLAILALIHLDRPLGYIGFDDCSAMRKWSSREVNLLNATANFVVSLINRRNSELNLIRSREVLQTITDNIENVIYVSDIHTHELVFLNKTLADTVGKPAEELIGQPCYKTLQRDMNGPCPFCPVPKMLAEHYDTGAKVYTWEFENTITHQWYLLKDSIVQWSDGREVHIETATEITHQKLYEERLRHYASTDMMTGAYNREWGYTIMKDLIASGNAEGKTDASIVFLDVDGLKIVNDTYGHDAGDELIIRTIETVRSCIRKSDVVCRWGGDEFLLLLQCNAEIAHRIIGNIYYKLDKINATGERPYNLGFSYGVASITDDPDEALDTVIAHADKLMYENKMSRRAAHQKEKS